MNKQKRDRALTSHTTKHINITKKWALWKAPSLVSQKKKECNLLPLMVHKVEYKAE